MTHIAIAKIAEVYIQRKREKTLFMFNESIFPIRRQKI